jgi:hydrogenase maturation factor
MCLAGIAVLAEVWDEQGARVGRLDDGDVVPLAFVPAATPGTYLLVQLGIPIEVLDPEDATAALELRAATNDPGPTR